MQLAHIPPCPYCGCQAHYVSASMARCAQCGYPRVWVNELRDILEAYNLLSLVDDDES